MEVHLRFVLSLRAINSNKIVMKYELSVEVELDKTNENLCKHSPSDSNQFRFIAE